MRISDWSSDVCSSDLDDESAHDPHKRVHPEPTVEPAGEKSGKGQNGCQRISEDMEIGGPQIVVVVTVPRAMSPMIMSRFVSVGVVVMIVVPSIMEKPGACEIDDQSEDSHGNGFIEADRGWRHQADDGFEPDQ